MSQADKKKHDITTEQEPLQILDLVKQHSESMGYQKGENENGSGTMQDAKMREFILSEFKVKYDQLKNQYEQKKKQADGLQYRNKKLEIEMLNQNVDYYEKQIKRLRAEVQKFQTENEEHKHKLYVVENTKNDLEALSKVKEKELKQAIKQFEKEKITVVELRHQLTEKDKNFSKIVEELQGSNQSSNEKYDQTKNKLSKVESELKIKSIQVDQLRRQLERKDKQLAKKKQDFDKQKQKHELQEYRLSHRLEDLEEDIKQYKSKENDTIKKLEAKVKDYEKRCATQEYVLIEKNNSADQVKAIRQKEIVIATLEQNIRELEVIVNNKNGQITGLKAKLEGVCQMSLLKQSQDRYHQMMTRFKATEKLLENRISELEKQLSLAKKSQPVMNETKMSGNFQQLLKSHIEENSKLKTQLKTKIQQIFTLKNKIEQQQIRQSLLQNEVDILKKKQKAQEKNSKIQFEIEIQNLRNEIQTLRRKLEVTETKFSIKIKEVKDKDTFITNVLIGRSKPQDVPFVTAELKRIFEADYSSKLGQANLRINDLQAKLAQR